MNLNLKQLRFAVAVASSGSFTEAAFTCCVTQPTLSNSIAQLEDDLGERVFERTTRKVSLTAFGAHLLPYMTEVLRAYSTLEQQARAYRQPEARLIRIGTSPLIRPQALSLMLEPFRAQHPGVDVVLREMNMTDLSRMLQEGLLDVVMGVVMGSAMGSSMSGSMVATGAPKGAWDSTPLYREALLYLPRGDAGSAPARETTVTFAEIADETFVMVPDACGLARTTRELFRRHRRRLHAYSGEAMSYQVLQEWAHLGVGAAILPRSKVANGKRLARAIVDKSGQPVTIGFEATWRRSDAPQACLQDFITHLRTVVPRLMAGLDGG